jgi:hypothetical protein
MIQSLTSLQVLLRPLHTLEGRLDKSQKRFNTTATAHNPWLNGTKDGQSHGIREID